MFLPIKIIIIIISWHLILWNIHVTKKSYQRIKKEKQQRSWSEQLHAIKKTQTPHMKHKNHLGDSTNTVQIKRLTN